MSFSEAFNGETPPLDMLRVTVALPSGRSASFSILKSSNVGDLKALALDCFQKHFLTLVNAAGRRLTDPMESLQTAGIQDEDQLTAVVGQAKLAATDFAFALWYCGGNEVITWGDPQFGGDSSSVQDQLREWAADSGDRQGICCYPGKWFGSDVGQLVRPRSAKVCVQQIQATRRAFAAILQNGAVVMWANPHFGHDFSAINDE